MSLSLYVTILYEFYLLYLQYFWDYFLDAAAQMMLQSSLSMNDLLWVPFLLQTNAKTEINSIHVSIP